MLVFFFENGYNDSMKLWIKTQKGEKVLFSAVAETDGNFSQSALSSALRDVLSGADIPSPIVLEYHAKRLRELNVARFKPSDFVEKVDFSSLTVELLRDEHEKKPHKRNPLDEA